MLACMRPLRMNSRAGASAAPALARDLPIVQELRHTADYRHQHLSARQATRALSKARAFVYTITRSLAHG